MSHARRSNAESNRSSPVIVATDGREQSDGAVRAGALFGELAGAWRVVSAAPIVYSFAPGLDFGMTAEALAVLRDGQRQAAEAQIRRVLGQSRSADVDIGSGSPAQVVVGLAAKTNASLIVSGLGRHRIVDRLLGDETALAIIRASSKPVLAVPQDFAHLPRMVVVGVDFSEASVHAGELALKLVDDAATMHLVNVAPPENVLNIVDGSFAAYEERATAELELLAAKLELSDRVDVQLHVRKGDPGSELLRCAEEAHAELIALGTRGRGFVARLFLGSVATKVVRASPIAVLTMPPTDGAPPWTGDR